jgi:hypothetical protein
MYTCKEPKLSCSEDKQPKYNQVAPQFCWVILDTKTVTYNHGVKDGQTKRHFFSQVLAFSWCGERQELEQNKCDKLQLEDHWVLEFFSYELLDYVSLSGFELGIVFDFWVNFCHFQTNKLGIIIFSSVNLTKFAKFVIKFHQTFHF